MSTTQQAPKIYVPKCNAKAQETIYGDIIKLSFNWAALSEFGDANVNAKGYLNIDVVPRKETGNYGETHNLVLNNWVKPDGDKPAAPAKTAPKKAGKKKEKEGEEEDGDGEEGSAIPF